MLRLSITASEIRSAVRCQVISVRGDFQLQLQLSASHIGRARPTQQTCIVVTVRPQQEHDGLALGQEGMCGAGGGGEWRRGER